MKFNFLALPIYEIDWQGGQYLFDFISFRKGLKLMNVGVDTLYFHINGKNCLMNKTEKYSVAKVKRLDECMFNFAADKDLVIKTRNRQDLLEEMAAWHNNKSRFLCHFSLDHIPEIKLGKDCSLQLNAHKEDIENIPENGCLPIINSIFDGEYIFTFPSQLKKEKYVLVGYVLPTEKKFKLYRTVKGLTV